MSGQNYDLKIEIGFSGGSISICKNQELIDQWTNQSPSLKSDFLLEAISSILQRNEIQTREIKKIVFAENVRSQTAYKTALATIKGISAVQNAEIILKDLFESIAEYFSARTKKNILVILQIKTDLFEIALIDVRGKKISRETVDSDGLLTIFEASIKKGTDDTVAAIKIQDDFFRKFPAIPNFDAVELVELRENLSVYL